MVYRLFYFGGILLFGVYSVYREVSIWYRSVESESYCRLGLGYYQLRMVGRYWSCRYIDLRDLLLFRQGWRTGVNRAAEAMTIFAVMCAGQFPIFHMGRVWMAFFVLPYPNTRGPVWPNFDSPLMWDVFAISTYFTVSLIILV